MSVYFLTYLCIIQLAPQLLNCKSSLFLQNKAKLEFQKIKKKATADISKMSWTSFKDKDLKRQLKFFYSSGNKMEIKDLKKVNDVFSSLILF